MKYKLHTTLNTILKHNPCADGLATLKEYLDKNNIGPDDHVNLLLILKSNGMRDCIWALRACLEYEAMCKVATYISAKAAQRAKEYADAARAAANDATDTAANAAYSDDYAAANAAANAANAANAAANAADVDAYAATAAAANAAAYAADADAAAYAAYAAEREKQKQDLLDILEDD